MGNWLIFFVLSQFFVEIFLMEGEAETQKEPPSQRNSANFF